MNPLLRASWVALRTLLTLSALCVAYGVIVTLVAQVAMPAQANGSLLQDRTGRVVGSRLLAQSFADADGNPLPRYFQPRPSAGDHDATASGGSNLGPENPELVTTIAERRAQVAKVNGVAESEVPADAVTASSSGLDPHISPAYARIQVARVAEARGLPAGRVDALVGEHTRAPSLGYLGEPTVNVLEVNLALDELEG